MILKKLIGLLNKQKMDTTVQEQTEDLFYIWTKSERAGEIVKPDLSKKDKQWLHFTDGTKINKELIGMYLMVHTSEEEAVNAAQVLGLTSVNKTLIPQPTVKATEPIKAPVIIEEPKVEVKEEVNVMMEMLRKMSKKNKAEMAVQVNIPTVEVYEMLKDQMDVTEEDLNENIVALVESQINNLKEQLKDQITTFIINYYNNGTTNTTNPKQKTKKSNATPERNSESSEDSGL